MKSLSTLFTVLALGASVATGAQAQQAQSQKIEVNDSLCISGKDQGTYNDAIKLMIALSQNFKTHAETEAFFTDPDKSQDVSIVKHGYTFLKVTARQTGYLMFDNEQGTSCQIKAETYDSLRKQLNTPTQGMVLN